MRFRELTNQEFNNFTINFPIKSIYQTPEYGFIMNNQGFDSMLLGLDRDGIIIAATLILIKKESGFKYAYAPRGFLLNYEDFYLVNDFTKQIKEYLSKKGIMGIKVNPMIVRNIYDFDTQTLEENPKYNLIYEALQHNTYYHLGYNNFFEALKPRFEAILDLNKPLPILFKNVKKEFRTKIRGAIKNGIQTFKGDFRELEYLYEFKKNKYDRDLNYYQDCYGYFSKRNMIDLYYTKLDAKKHLQEVQRKLNYYEQQSSILSNQIIKNARKNPQNLINKKINMDKYLNQYKNELVKATTILREYPNGVITSCALIVKQDKNVTILIDGYDEKFRKFNSKHLLIWQLIEIYQKQGFTSFNLGGLSNMVVDTSKYTGLNEFKLSFGSKMIEYAGDFELITNKRNYNLYRNTVPLKNLIKNKLTK